MIKLTCHSCGGKLEITDDIERFACGHCGNEWIVNRAGGIVSLKAVEEHLSKVQEHTKETAEHTKETAEHSKIIADDIKLKKIKERINALTFEANRIDKNPQKKNDKQYAPLKISAVVSFFSFCFALIFFSLSFLCNRQSPTTSILPIGFIIFFILIFVSLLFGLFLSVFSSDTIPDEQQLQVNLNRVKEIAKELNELARKSKEIEAGFLK